MPIFSRSCCGCSLESGSKAIAIYYIVSQSLSILTCISLLANLSNLLNINYFCYDSSSNYNSLSDRRIRDDCKDLRDDLQSFFDALRPILIFTLIMAITMLIISSILLYGINRRRRGFMLPWIIAQSISLAGICIVVIVACSTVTGSYKGSVYGPSIVFGFFGSAIGVYFILVVISHYQQLGDPNYQPNPSYPPTHVIIQTHTTPGPGPVVTYAPGVMHSPGGIVIQQGYAPPPPNQQQQYMPQQQQQYMPQQHVQNAYEQPPPYVAGQENKAFHS